MYTTGYAQRYRKQNRVVYKTHWKPPSATLIATHSIHSSHCAPPKALQSLLQTPYSPYSTARRPNSHIQSTTPAQHHYFYLMQLPRPLFVVFYSLLIQHAAGLAVPRHVDYPTKVAMCLKTSPGGYHFDTTGCSAKLQGLFESCIKNLCK